MAAKNSDIEASPVVCAAIKDTLLDFREDARARLATRAMGQPAESDRPAAPTLRRASSRDGAACRKFLPRSVSGDRNFRGRGSATSTGVRCGSGGAHGPR